MASSETLEVERKYEAAEGDELPALDSLAGVDRVGPPEEESLEAVYFDTAGLALASRRITLRQADRGPRCRMALKAPCGGR
ncbi:hypothetical protein ACOM2C_02740 [Pseudarthrobacter sp. So.54]